MADALADPVLSGPFDPPSRYFELGPNEESVSSCCFTGGGDPYKRLKTALKAEIDVDAWASLNSTVSRPFPKPLEGKIAVKVINDYGDEVMKVFEV